MCINNLNTMEVQRIAIIDHESKRLYVEDVDKKVVKEQYNGSTTEYILDNYSLCGTFTWDVIEDTEFIPADSDPISVEFNDLI